MLRSLLPLYSTKPPTKHIIICFVLGLTTFFCAELCADPWGKDADLANPRSKKKSEKCQTPLLGTFAEKMIGFHQKIISPADGPRSNFYPCSSPIHSQRHAQIWFLPRLFYGLRSTHA